MIQQLNYLMKVYILLFVTRKFYSKKKLFKYTIHIA